MRKFIMYIGADNITNRVDIVKINEMVSSEYSGYTLVKSLGYWNGTPEDSVQVILLTEDSIEKVERLAEKMRKALNQFSIYLEVSLVHLVNVNAKGND